MLVKCMNRVEAWARDAKRVRSMRRIKGKMLGEANSKRIRLVQTGKKKQAHMRVSYFGEILGKKKKKKGS